jgi:hypothetical protein
MISVRIDNANEFLKELTEKQLVEKFGIIVGQPTKQLYGLEINMIDMAGVCWHFVE